MKGLVSLVVALVALGSGTALFETFGSARELLVLAQLPRFIAAAAAGP
jgi:hypothetical protein